MENDQNHIIPYATFLKILGALITMTLISVAITSIYLGALTVFVALLIAVIKAGLVLHTFMHLRFENRMFTILTIGVAVLIGFVIIGTITDYIFR